MSLESEVNLVGALVYLSLFLHFFIWQRVYRNRDRLDDQVEYRIHLERKVSEVLSEHRERIEKLEDAVGDAND